MLINIFTRSKQFKDTATYDNINKKMNTHSTTNNDVVTQGVSADGSRVTGCVKWFNNKAGYGFITVSNGPHSGDVFVHHSAINVGEEQYRFLVQGEYVEFECVRVEDGPHQWQASNVTGPNDGRLMCETRRVVRSSRSTHSPETQEEPRETYTRPQRHPRQQSGQYVQSSEQHPRHSHRPQVSQGPGPRVHREAPVSDRDGYEWLLVRRYPNGERGAPSGDRTDRDRPDRPRPRRLRSVVSQEQV